MYNRFISMVCFFGVICVGEWGSRCTCQEIEKISSTAEEPNVAKQLVWVLLTG